MNIVGKERYTREVIKVAKSAKIIPDLIYDYSGESMVDEAWGVKIASMPSKPEGPIVIAIEDNELRKSMAGSLKGTAIESAIVHKSAMVKGALGVGTIVMDMVSMGQKTRVGNHCIIGSGVIIGKECTIGDFVSIGEDCKIGDGVQIGEGCEIKSGSVIASGTIVGAWSTILSHSFVNKEVEAMKKVSGIHGAL